MVFFVKIICHAIYYSYIYIAVLWKSQKINTQKYPDLLNADNCTEGELRLVGGAHEREGRIEICLYGVWGTICDDYWSTADANVACKQLGFGNTGI